MTDTGVPNIYNPFADPRELLGYLISETETGFQAFFGRPTPAQQDLAASAVQAAMARAGATPQQQKAAADEYRNQVKAASKNFDQNDKASVTNPFGSNVVQRAFDYALPETTDAEDVIDFEDFDWSTVLNAADWKSVVIVVLVGFIVFLIVREVL